MTDTLTAGLKLYVWENLRDNEGSWRVGTVVALAHNEDEAKILAADAMRRWFSDEETADSFVEDMYRKEVATVVQSAYALFVEYTD